MGRDLRIEKAVTDILYEINSQNTLKKGKFMPRNLSSQGVQAAVYDLLCQDTTLCENLTNGASDIYNILPPNPEFPCLRVAIAKIVKDGTQDGHIFKITVSVDCYSRQKSDVELNRISADVVRVLDHADANMQDAIWIESRFAADIRNAAMDNEIRYTRLMFDIVIEPV